MGLHRPVTNREIEKCAQFITNQRDMSSKSVAVDEQVFHQLFNPLLLFGELEWEYTECGGR